MPTLRRSVLAFLVLAQPASAQTDTSKVAILRGTELLHQCSRSSPAADGTWEPTLADVERLEALLPAALAGAPRASVPAASRVLSGWARQYAGVVRGGRRFLYGSFFPADMFGSIPDWRTKPVIVCDGGPDVFGIEMDVERGTISHIAFNGSA